MSSATYISFFKTAWYRQGQLWLCTMVIIMAVLLSFSSCKPRNKVKQAKTACVKTATLPLKYAKGFAVDYYDGFKVITLKDLKDSSKILARYVLLPAHKPAPVGFESATLITNPAGKTVCISTTTMGEMSALNLADSIGAVTDVDLIYDTAITRRIAQHLIWPPIMKGIFMPWIWIKR